MDSNTAVEKHEDFSVKYDRIVERIKVLAINIGNHCWEIGDLLLEADANFPTPENMGVPGYMLIGCHMPNFWKQMSDLVGLSVASLKLYAAVACAFPPEKRRPELTWGHHLASYVYVDRDKYLQVCIDQRMEAYGKPQTIRWLEQYIDQQENCVQYAKEPRRSVSIDLPLDMLRKFSDLARHYYHKPVKDIVAKAVRPILEAYLTKEAERIALEFFDWNDGGKTWPFGPQAKKVFGKRRDEKEKPLVTIRRVA
jgi:hypothetical protein